MGRSEEHTSELQSQTFSTWTPAAWQGEPQDVRIFLDSYGDTPVCEAAGTESLITPVQL